MNENGRKKREWIKTAAIVFLSVMLVLTFFSSTIQNWSLPEVATQYVQSGTITAKIRGTGTVESTDPYDVKLKETRKVDSVAVRTGDKVEQGDVLIYLAAGDGDELKTAKDELEAAKNRYNDAILSDKMSVADISAANNGLTAENYRSQLTIAQNAVRAAENVLKPRQDEVARIQQLIDDCNQQVSYEQSMNSLAPERLKAAEAALGKAEENRKAAEEEKGRADRWLDEAQASLAEWESGFNSVSAGDAAYVEAFEAEKQKRQENLDAARDNYNYKNDRYNDAVNNENDARNVYNDAVNYKAEREGSQSILNLNDAVAGFKIDLYNAQKDLKEAEADLTAKQKTLTELLSRIGNVSELQSYLDAIEKAQKKVDELSAKTEGTTVTAPITGTITSINVRAGETPARDSVLIVMQREGRGYTLSFSVTNDQAKRLSVGDKADLVNSWRYNDVEVTLANIRPDPSNPSQNKLLTFDVKGDVVAGQTLSLSVGQKSANYDFIVPNSAIREDNNGKFILKVESKSSPLGTRYTASRVDVEVIAGDDTQSAVRGDLQGYEFVITTSTKPVEDGKLVRLPD